MGESASDAIGLMAIYPTSAILRFPAVGAPQTLLDKEMIPLLRRYMGAPGNNATAFQNTLSETRADYWYRRGLPIQPKLRGRAHQAREEPIRERIQGRAVPLA